MASRGKTRQGRARASQSSRTRARRDSEGRHISRLYRRIYAVVRRIPRGRVATYGQVAELAGIPGGARVVGTAMRVSTPEMGLPWQRVVGKRSASAAYVSIHDPVGAAVQRALLEDEGVTLSDAGSISLARYGWLPRKSKPPGVRRARTTRR